MPCPVLDVFSGGAWKLAPSPGTSSLNELYGVECTSSTSCVAVGDYGNNTFQRTLLEILPGTRGGSGERRLFTSVDVPQLPARYRRSRAS